MVYARHCHSGKLYRTAVVVVFWLSVSPAFVTHRLWWGCICSACFILGSGTNHTQTLPKYLPPTLGLFFPICHCTTEESENAVIWDFVCDLLEVLDTNKNRDCFERCFPFCFDADSLPWGSMYTECCLTSNVVWISCFGWVEGLATCFLSVKP